MSTRFPSRILRMAKLGFVAALMIGGSSGKSFADPSGVWSNPSSCGNTGLGYLTAPSLSPGHILRPSSFFVLPILSARGAERVDFDCHWGNVWNYTPNEYMIDGEWIRSSLRYSYAVKDDVSVGLALPIIGRMGGFVDSAIERFHSAAGLGNANRKEFPRNRSLITVTDQGVDRVIARGESWGIGDVSAFVVSSLTEGTYGLPAVSVQGEVFLPTGNEDELRGMGAPAISLSSVASKRLWTSPLILYLGAGIQYCDADDVAMIRIRDEQVSGLAGLEYQYSQSFSVLVQYLISSPVAKHYYALAKPSHEVSFGFKWRVGSDAALELAVVENVAVFQNSADIGVHLAFGRRL